MSTYYASRSYPLLPRCHWQLPCQHCTHPGCPELHCRSSVTFFYAGISLGSTQCRPQPLPSHHPCGLDRALTARLHSFQLMGIAPSTRRTYQAGIHRYHSFCTKYHIKPLPASALTLRFFAAHLAPTVKHSTIKLYLSALRLYHLENGWPDPTQDVLLKYVVKGIRRSQVSPPRPRLPITLKILHSLKTQLHHNTALSLHDKRMLWAAFTLAFYGFLRASEFTSPSPRSYDPTVTLCRQDITIQTTTLKLLVKASKTDPFRQTCTLTIGATGTSTCPVVSLNKFLSFAKQAPTQPLFCFQDGTFLTRLSLTSHLRYLLTAAGYNADTYGSHSFRIGAATTAAAADLPTWQIQALGRWTSTCYTRYIRTPSSVFATATQKIASMHLPSSP